MLSPQDNDLLCRVGPGTPMGELFRQYWLPAVRSDELEGPDSAPLRVMLLGEKLIAYRATSGNVGLVADACPHRGASMFFGRNEEEGLRCVYHGWKFDSTGACVDMPSEPAESNFKNKVRIRAYPTRERNGIIWAYMGPRSADNLPPLPDIEANLLNKDPKKIKVIARPNNWMQGIEGEMDTIHFVFLHMGSERLEDRSPAASTPTSSPSAPASSSSRRRTGAAPTASTVRQSPTRTTGASATRSSRSSRSRPPVPSAPAR